jgi:outer membrane protein OmpA-like peptidoglycan-associated protein
MWESTRYRREPPQTSVASSWGAAADARRRPHGSGGFPLNRTESRTLGLGALLGLALTAGGDARLEKYVDTRGGRLVRAQAGQAQTTANEALQRANEAHKLAQGKFLYDVVLSDDAVKFPVNQDELSPEARSRLDTLAQRVKSENKNVYLEIQGFTDASGDPKHNEKLGEARAESVRKYLHRQGIALNRMTTISYGEEDPVAPNTTPKGRAQNRRVMIVVLI